MPAPRSRGRFDAVVVGGGPAGSAAATVLARGGARVCVVDRAAFPRDKLCGGLLTLRSAKVFADVFGGDWSSTIAARSTGVRFFFGHRLLTDVRDYTHIAFTCRRDFDAALLQIARDAGADVVEQTTAKSVDPDRGTVQLIDGTIIEGRFVIGADGVNSVVARSLYGQSFDKRRIGFALEAEIPRAAVAHADADPEIYFGVLPWGYGWVFPKRETLTAGVGGLHARNADMRSRFDAFLRRRFGDVVLRTIPKVRGHYIPFGGFRRDPGRGNVLLCGDAAGLVEPLTGEGIAFAMQSGGAAGRAVLASLRSRERADASVAASAGTRAAALATYRREYAHITGALQTANALRLLVFPWPAQALLARALPKTRSVPRKHLDLMADQITYPQYVRHLIATLTVGPVRKVVRSALGQRS